MITASVVVVGATCNRASALDMSGTRGGAAANPSACGVTSRIRGRSNRDAGVARDADSRSAPFATTSNAARRSWVASAPSDAARATDARATRSTTMANLDAALGTRDDDARDDGAASRSDEAHARRVDARRRRATSDRIR